MSMERPSIAASAFDRPGVRVRTLANIRWIAILGQFTTLLVVGLWFGYPLPWGSLLAAVGASVILNFGLSTLYERTDRMTGRELSLHLAFDLIQAGVLLFLTGGLANPVVSVAETGAAVFMTLLSLFIPCAAVLLALLLAFWAWRKYRAYQRNKHPVTTV